MTKVPSSFRDPAGFIYRKDNILYRQVTQQGAGDYDAFMKRLYPALVERGLIVQHTEVSHEFAYSDDAHQVLRPELIPFISYPYEWTFEQLKDAALLTLRVQKIAMKLGFILKDASAYNIQFIGTKPIFIDTLSFAKYEVGQPWEAYQQFCQHFLAPLALASYRDPQLIRLLRNNVDGIALKIASQLLPWTTRLRPSIQMHIHFHARLQERSQKGENDATNERKSKVATKSIENIVSDLQALVKSLQWTSDTTPWEDYYEGDSYIDIAFDNKKSLVKRYIDEVHPAIVWDLGANAGEFSQLTNTTTIAWDFDEGAVQRHYQTLKAQSNETILPLVQDLMNPSPDIGWMNTERDGLLKRAQGTDLVMALALIHHIAIANNVPLASFAEFLSQIAPHAIVEFVPKSDAKVQLLLRDRRDIFPDYTQAGFEQAFSIYYDVVHAENIADSERILYLLKAKS
ncbi:MAG: SAM-dependent methyltransferase [Chloroflexota bacterium]